MVSSVLYSSKYTPSWQGLGMGLLLSSNAHFLGRIHLDGQGRWFHYHLPWVRRLIIISCVSGVLERIETKSLKRIIWGLNWTSPQIVIPCIACFNLQSQGVGSNNWYSKSTDQQPMSDRTKRELCPCFGLLSQPNLGLSMLKFIKTWLQYLSSLQPSFL